MFLVFAAGKTERLEKHIYDAELHISLETKTNQVNDMKSSLISFRKFITLSLDKHYSNKLQEPLVWIHFGSVTDILILFSQYCFQFADGDFLRHVKRFVKPAAVMCDKTCS